jgi:hypothetical protein
MRYWQTPYGRETRRRYVLWWTPIWPVVAVLCVWLDQWAVVAISVAMTIFCVWRLRGLSSLPNRRP